MSAIPHQFESITEFEWRNGKNRHKCAVCRRDYDDSVHLPPSPTVPFTDYFVSGSASIVMEFAAELDAESFAAGITCWAYEAEGELMRN